MRLISIVVLCFLLAQAYSKRKQGGEEKPSENKVVLASVPAAASIKLVKPLAKKPFVKPAKEIEEQYLKIYTELLEGREHAELVMEKGSTEALRNYGSNLMKDQLWLETKFKNIAKSKGIDLPRNSAGSKNIADLKEKSGKTFDRRFIKTLRKDFRKDIKVIKDAEDTKDPELKNFAAEYRVRLEAQLQSLNQAAK